MDRQNQPIDHEKEVAMDASLNRRQIIVAASIVSVSAPAAAGKVPSAPDTVLYEHTFLRALPGKRDAMLRYITANWFVMDTLGVEQGIFTGF
jgi:hypothetical protein